MRNACFRVRHGKHSVVLRRGLRVLREKGREARGEGVKSSGGTSGTDEVGLNGSPATRGVPTDPESKRAQQAREAFAEAGWGGLRRQPAIKGETRRRGALPSLKTRAPAVPVFTARGRNPAARNEWLDERAPSTSNAAADDNKNSGERRGERFDTTLDKQRARERMEGVGCP